MSTLAQLAADMKTARQNLAVAKGEHAAILEQRKLLQQQLEQCFEDERSKLAEIETLKTARDGIMDQISSRAP